MSSLLSDYLAAVWGLFVESAPYLLFGFLCAGILRVLIPADRIQRWIGGNDLRSVLRASLLGIPLPLCSCSVLPTAATLRKSGASKGATTSFLISTPETGVDSIAITWALLGPVMTIARPVSALVSALLGGSLVNGLVRRGWETEESEADEGPAGSGSAPAGHSHPAAPEDEGADGARATAEPQSDGAPPDRRAALLGGLRWSFTRLLDDLNSWLVLGFLISGVITLVLPSDFFGGTVPQGFASMLVMLALGTPMYICAAATTPVAAALMMKGLDPGAALVLLLVGPATNMTTLAVLKKVLGGRALLVYLGTVMGVALAAGATVDALFDIPPPAIATEGAEGGGATFGVLMAVVLALLMLRSALRIGMLGQWERAAARAGGRLGLPGLRHAIRGLPVLLLLLGWLSTSVSSVPPGEHGWLLRFGRIEAVLSEPGAVWHYPWPIDRVETLRTEEVRGLEVGFRRSDTGETEQALLEESEVLTGDENLLSVQFTVHYAVRDPHRLRFGVQDDRHVVHSLAEAAVRQAVARRSADEVLVELQDVVGAEAGASLQAELDRVDSGLEVLRVRLVEVHATPMTHADFRDVASAMEDRERRVHEAEAYAVETRADARVQAAEERVEARAAALSAISIAEGDAAAFRARAEAFRDHEPITRLRLRFDAEEEALRRAAAVFLLGEDIDVETWVTEPRSASPPGAAGAGARGGPAPTFRDPWERIPEEDRR